LLQLKLLLLLLRLKLRQNVLLLLLLNMVHWLARWHKGAVPLKRAWMNRFSPLTMRYF
jgi:hypothetical protein